MNGVYSTEKEKPKALKKKKMKKEFREEEKQRRLWESNPRPHG